METIKAVLDRIVDQQHAVILAETIGEDYIVPVDRLPSGAQEGSWLLVDCSDGEVVNITLDSHTTASREKEVAETLNRLKKKSRGSKFKRE